jgi:hypothetical protein
MYFAIAQAHWSLKLCERPGTTRVMQNLTIAKSKNYGHSSPRLICRSQGSGEGC